MMGEVEGDERAEGIAEGMARAARQVRADIVGGHTERTPGLSHSIVATTAFAFVDEYVTAAGAKEGDAIVLTKMAGMEGTSILAAMFKERLSTLGRRTLNEARCLSERMSVVDEAEAAFATGGVHAMHDPTEGGVLGGLYEMGVGSGLGFQLDEGSIPIAKSTKEITARLGVDPLRLIASGSMLMAVAERKVPDVLRAVREAGVEASVVGAFGGSEGTLLRKDGSREKVDETIQDELWRMAGE